MHRGSLLGAQPGGLVRVVIADSDELFRHAVRKALEAEGHCDVVGVASSGEEVARQVEAGRADVVLLDPALPGSSEALASLTARIPPCRVLVLVADEDSRPLITDVERGARGFVSKSSSTEELLHAMSAVRRGETVVPPAMLTRLLDEVVQRRRHHNEEVKRLSRLTAREREVLSLLADGMKIASIARALVISPETARTHVQRILSKLELHSQIEAAAFVARNGFRHALHAPAAGDEQSRASADRGRA